MATRQLVYDFKLDLNMKNFQSSIQKALEGFKEIEGKMSIFDRIDKSLKNMSSSHYVDKLSKSLITLNKQLNRTRILYKQGLRQVANDARKDALNNAKIGVYNARTDTQNARTAGIYANNLLVDEKIKTQVNKTQAVIDQSKQKLQFNLEKFNNLMDTKQLKLENTRMNIDFRRIKDLVGLGLNSSEIEQIMSGGSLSKFLGQERLNEIIQERVKAYRGINQQLTRQEYLNKKNYQLQVNQANTLKDMVKMYLTFPVFKGIVSNVINTRAEYENAAMTLAMSMKNYGSPTAGYPTNKRFAMANTVVKQLVSEGGAYGIDVFGALPHIGKFLSAPIAGKSFSEQTKMASTILRWTSLLQLDTRAVSSVFRAFSDMMGMPRVRKQEAFNQLGQAAPAALSVMEKAFGMNRVSLMNMITNPKNGIESQEFIKKFVDQLKLELDENEMPQAIGRATTGLGAAWQNLKASMGGGMFSSTLTPLIKALTSIVNLLSKSEGIFSTFFLVFTTGGIVYFIRHLMNLAKSFGKIYMNVTRLNQVLPLTAARIESITERLEAAKGRTASAKQNAYYDRVETIVKVNKMFDRVDAWGAVISALGLGISGFSKVGGTWNRVGNLLGATEPLLYGSKMVAGATRGIVGGLGNFATSHGWAATGGLLSSLAAGALSSWVFPAILAAGGAYFVWNAMKQEALKDTDMKEQKEVKVNIGLDSGLILRNMNTSPSMDGNVTIMNTSNNLGWQ